MTSQCLNSVGDYPASNDEVNQCTALHTSGLEALEPYRVGPLPPHRGRSLSNMEWGTQLLLHEACSNNLPAINQSNLSRNSSPNTISGSDLNLNIRKSLSSTENIPSDLSTPSSSVLQIQSNWRSNCAHQPCDTDCLADLKNSPDGFVPSVEESFHFQSLSPSDTSECLLIQDNSTNKIFSTFSSSLKGGDTMNSCADDSGFEFYEGDSSRLLNSSMECTKLCCQETASTNKRLIKELLEMKMNLGVKDASLARLKDAITQQFLEKEDILQLKTKSETNLRACEQQLETTRKSEIHFRDNFYESAAELNTLRREHCLLQGEMAWNKILTNKLHAEKSQINNLPNKSYTCGSRENVILTEPAFEAESRYQEQLVPPLEEKVLLLEKQMEKLQDDTEDLTFKAQRHEEEAASLCSQNTQLVKKCSDLQRQLVECLSMVDVLDVRCNDAESKLERTRQALEEKEKALLSLSCEHTECLVKIEENEREMERVRTEMDNVTRNFVKISCNQRELKEDLSSYKNVLRTRDQKIKQLTEDRKSMLAYLEELKARVPGAINKKEIVVQTSFPDELPEPWTEQCTDLMKNIAVGDDLMAEQMEILKSENERLAAEVESLNSDLENRCAAGVLKMTHIMETIERLENDMNQFLSTVEQKTEVGIPKEEVVGDGDSQGSKRLLRENSEMMQQLEKMKEEAQALRRTNFDLEEQLKKHTFWFEAVLQGQEAGARQVAREKLADLKIGPQNRVSIDPMLLRDPPDLVNKAQQTESDLQGNDEPRTNRLPVETKAVLLENANNELVIYIDSLHKSLAQKSAAEQSGGQYLLKTLQDFFHAVDLLTIPQTGFNVFDELYRISVFLQVCLLKTRSIVSKNKGNYIPVISGLEDLLLTVRSAMSSNGSLEGPANHPLVTLPITADCGPSEAEPNILVASKTELESQLAVYQKNNDMLREALAISEEERRKEENRHKSQLHEVIQKFKLRLKENKINVSTWTSEPVKDGYRETQETSFKSEHRVCTDMVVNLQRNLRASESANIEVQKQLRAKTEETWRLYQELSNLRSSLEAVNDILDNKKIALGRSEAMGQMLRVSEASLEQRLEMEQRQHEDCRQHLDQLAASLQETQTKNEDIKELRRQLVEKEERLTAVSKDYYEAVKEQEILLKRCKDKDRELEEMRDEIEEGVKFRKLFPLAYHAVLGNDFAINGESKSNLALPSPAPIMNQTELLNLIERAKSPRKDIMRLLDDCVSHMSEQLNSLQLHLEEKRRSDSSVLA